MANTVARTGNIITVVFDGSTALDFATNTTINLPNGAYFGRIEFKPNAVNDAVSIREAASDGIEAHYFKSITGDSLKIDMTREFHKYYVVGNEASASSKLIIQLAE